MPKIRNIIIFTLIALALILIYIFVIKPSSSSQPSLVSSSPVLPNINTSGTDTSTSNGTASVTQDFLTLLLNIKNIKLDDVIFSDLSFSSLHDSSIILIPDSTEGRPNPFAQFGNDSVTIVPTDIPNVSPTSPTPPFSSIPPSSPTPPSSTIPPSPPKPPSSIIPPTPPSSTIPPSPPKPPSSTIPPSPPKPPSSIIPPTPPSSTIPPSPPTPSSIDTSALIKPKT